MIFPMMGRLRWLIACMLLPLCVGRGCLVGCSREDVRLFTAGGIVPKGSQKKLQERHSGQGNLAFGDEAISPRRPPSTRYQGSKLKLIPWILDSVRELSFHTVLDAFGGTGAVSYAFKSIGKGVTYNDYLDFNRVVGLALVANQTTRLSDDDMDFVLRRHGDVAYDDFIARSFSGIFFTDAENQWLDVVVQNIHRIDDPIKQAVAFYAIFQSCIIKRPYNLFHRANLYMRLSEVTRSFGNKTTWDAPFETHFRSFVAEVNRHVFDSGVECAAVCGDAGHVPGTFDLVYVDPPYVNKAGLGVDYLDFYHFLEGVMDYKNWGDRLDRKRKHLPLKGERSPWSSNDTIHAAFRDLFARFSDSTLVVSYRSDGVPSEQELVEMVRAVKGDVRLLRYGGYKYALSKNSNSQEVLIVGT